MSRRLIASICVLALLWVPAVSRADVSLEEEIKIGREAFEEVKSEIPFIKDPDSLDYLRKLGARVAAARPDSPFTYKFYLADLPEFNAFALPGGWMVFFRGLFTQLDTEGELVSIMAHEMSHVYFRHAIARMKKSGPVNAAMIAGMLAGVLMGMLSGAPQLGQALTVGSAAGGIQAHLAFSREDEVQADYGAYQIVTKLGYDPREMEKTFERLWREERNTSTTPPAYLLTHPTSPERMETLQNLVRRHPAQATSYENREFLRIRTRLVALYEPEDSAYQAFLRQNREKPAEPYPIYGLSLVEMRRGRFKEALAYLDRLAKKWPDRSFIWRAQGNCYLGLGEYTKAQDLLNRALAEKPDDLESLLALGQSYLRQGHLEPARHIFLRILSLNPQDSQAHYELGVTLGKMGRTAEASLHLGLSFKERGNQRLALFHLERAVRELKGQPELLRQAQAALDQIKNKDKKKRTAKGEGGSREK